MSRAKSPSPTGIPTQSIIWAAIGWATLALIFYLFLSAPTDGPHIIKPPEECNKTVIELTVKPNSNDIIPVRDQIVEVDVANSSITVEPDTFVGGSADAGIGYSTATSY